MFRILKPSDVTHIVVHCSATPPTMDIGVQEIDRWHRERGWLKVGYHYIVRRNGVVELGRTCGQRGAHAVGYNHRSLSICLIGGVDSNNKPRRNFTTEQYEALRAQLECLKSLYPKAIIVGHRDLSPDTNGNGVVDPHEWTKACPSFDVREWLKEVGM